MSEREISPRQPLPASQNPSGRPARHPDGAQRMHRAPRPSRREDGTGEGAERGAHPAELLKDLDLELMKLLVRRARLLSKIRDGKNHAASPRAVSAEKEVRASWEKNAPKFSRDPRFVRQLYSLLQELEMQSREEAENFGGFVLSPVRKPVELYIPAPVSIRQTRFLAALSAGLGRPCSAENILPGEALIALSKALNQAGAGFSWVGAWPGSTRLNNLGSKRAESEAGELSFKDAAFFAGDDLFNFYLLVFLAIREAGKVRFIGDSSLKMADLGALRRFLPSLGARLAHGIPGSTGLPASVEASGEIPEHIAIPSELPEEACLALLCASAAWQKAVRLDLSKLPEAFSSMALAELVPLWAFFGVSHELRGTELILAPPPRLAQVEEENVRVPEIRIMADPVIGAYLLALPAFAGGEVKLRGSWSQDAPDSLAALSLLQNAGLEIIVTEADISAKQSEGRKARALRPGQNIRKDLQPLHHALNCLALKQGGEACPIQPQAADRALAEDFYALLGYELNEQGLPVQKESGPESVREAANPQAPQSVPWTSPGAFWSLALALCAYIAPRPRLSNPAQVTDMLPGFWNLYNSLPVPALRETAAVPQPEKAARRRIIARDVKIEE